MTRRAYLYFGLTFLLGVIVGSVGMFFFGWYGGYLHRTTHKQFIIRRLRRDLSLTDPQVQQLNQIIDDTTRKYDDLREQVRPQFRAIREESQERIRHILTPEQLEKFNAQIRRHEERMKRERSP